MTRNFDRVDPTMDGVHWVATSKEAAFHPRTAEWQENYDLAVIGAGFCGLTIALEAAQKGLSVILLEAGTIGCGASGRNGGIVVPNLPGARTPSFLETVFGQKRAARLIELVRTGPDFVFERAKHLEIACDANPAGWVQPAHNENALKSARLLYQDWAERGADVTWLDGAEVKDNLGAEGYLGGWYSASGGTINPWALTQGLARAAEAAGAMIVENTAVNAVARDGSANILRTKSGSVRAMKVAITTNGYTSNLVAGLKNTVIPVRLFHCLTRPLSEGERVGILPKGAPFTDLRKSGGFCRFDAEGRVMSGGAVFTASNVRSYGMRHAAKRMAELYPRLAGIEIEHYWEGWCAIREDFLPIVQNHGHGVFSLLGFSTRGIALSQTLGTQMARFLAEDLPEAELPIPVHEPSPIKLRALKQEFGGLAFPVYQWRDRLNV